MTASLTPLSAKAQHTQHGSTGAVSGSLNEPPATRAYRAANAKMHGDMDVAFTGDADADSMRAMIPHHEGAIAMADIELTYGRDPAVRRLAAAVVATQRLEIAELRNWFARRKPRKERLISMLGLTPVNEDEGRALGTR